VLLVGTTRVLQGDLTFGSMLALNGLATGFLLPLATLIEKLAQLRTLDVYVDRLDDVFKRAPEIDHTIASMNQPPSGAVRLEDVSFRYAEHGSYVLRNLTLDIRPGEFIAIVGASGAGKSTLAALLAGLHRPTHGRILYDGRDLATLEPRALRRSLGIVLQRPHLFRASIRGNISLAHQGLPLARVIEAAQAAGIHDDVMAMPMQYETLLFEDGATLSGGQRQRIALARALVHKPALLLLDEATSALDVVTEARVQANLEELRSTRIVVAHRLSTVARADRIVVLDGGRVVEQGTHAELLERGGVYESLLAAQLRA
jgi:ABC-type bacteriocin/lantibiotic exporter with double-glycine peptidase domain